MAAINDLIAQIQDPILRAKIEQEANKLSKQKKFGLVFEEHLPESTRLYGVPIRKGSMVTLKNDKNGQTFVVLRNYLGSDRSMADGFKANAAFFKLGFLDKTSVALGRQFEEMLPTLWMKAGAYGPCPMVDGEKTPDMLILPENKFAVLTIEASFEVFADMVNGIPEIQSGYIVTDYEIGYRSMIKNINAPNTYQLYRDYLDNFRINTGRN